MDETSLTIIPGIGKMFVKDFARIGLHFVEDFENKDADIVFQTLVKANLKENHKTSKSYLYVIRMIIYYAQGGREADKLKWNAWKN
jgi:Pathogenicity locus